MIGLLEPLFYASILLIGIAYYYDFRQGPTQFKSDIKGGAFYLLGILVFVIVERVVFNIGVIYIILQIAVLIMLSFWIKFSMQKGK